MKNLHKSMLTAAFIFVPQIAFAADNGETTATPLVYTLSMFGLVISVILLFASAYVFVSLRSIKKRLNKVDKLQADVKALIGQVHSLRGSVSAAEDEAENTPPVKASVPDIKTADGTSIESKIWLPFVEKFNKLAAEVKEPKITPAITQFVEENKLKALMCIDHSIPKFVAAEEPGGGNFWLWALPNDPERFIVVPNPTVHYTENLHFEGGLKETFASNYDENDKSKEYTKITVKLPAVFKKSDENTDWYVEQPGLIGLEE